MLIAIEFLFILFLTIVLFMIFKREGASFKKRLHKAKIEGCWTGENRRQHPRFPKSLEMVYVVIKNNTVKNTAGHTVNISEGGIKVILDEKLPPGTSLSLKISISDSGKTTDLIGDVVWTEDAVEIEDSSGKRFFYSGIKFSSTNAPSGNDLTEYIRSLTKGQKK